MDKQQKGNSIIRVTRRVVIQGQRRWVEETLANSLVEPGRQFVAELGTISEPLPRQIEVLEEENG